MFDSQFATHASDPIVGAIAVEAARREQADDEQWRAIARLADAYQGISLAFQWWERFRRLLVALIVLGALQFVLTCLLLLRS